MKFAMCLETAVGPKWVNARQMGVDHAVVLGPTDGSAQLHDYGNLLMLKKTFDKFNEIFCKDVVEIVSEFGEVDSWAEEP